MNFQPVIPGSGLAGWRFLQRTYDQQFEAFSKSSQLKRDSNYFSERISSITSAEDLVADRRLLGVALGAFGLQDDINNRYFIQKILQDGVSREDTLANRLADVRYRKLSEAFGFGPGETLETGNTTRMAEILQQNKIQSFEVSVGEQDEAMRIALFAQRELESLASDSLSNDAKWFSLMSLPPLRTMFETALGLPAAFGQIDIDKQLQVFQDKTGTLMGNSSIDQFSDPEIRKKFTDLFLARSQIANIGLGNSPGENALVLLRFAGF
jgi:Protein of unknown function (DUF1217)